MSESRLQRCNRDRPTHRKRDPDTIHGVGKPPPGSHSSESCRYGMAMQPTHIHLHNQLRGRAVPSPEGGGGGDGPTRKTGYNAVSEMSTTLNRNLPKKRCGLYQQVLDRRDVTDGNYAEGFRAFWVRVESPKPVPEYVDHVARRLDMETVRPEPSMWLFAEADP